MTSDQPVPPRITPAGRRRAAIVAGALIVAATATFGVVRAFDGPDLMVVGEIDGRTWLSTSGSDGPLLVLANGISGLVEGQVSGLDLRSADVAFAGSDIRHTLLSTPDESVLLADGRQTATTFNTDGAQSVIAAAGIVTVADDVRLRRISGDAAVTEPEVLALDGDPAPAAAPVVDGEGRAWLLLDTAAGERRAQAIEADGSAGEAHDAVDATGLALVDGRAMLRTASAIRPLSGGDGFAVPGDGGVAPSVAVDTDGAWAVADGGRLAVTGSVAGTVETAGPVTALAVWHGRVWASTDDALVTITESGPERVEGFNGRARVFTDGGRLWFVTPDVAAAIDRDQHVTVFTLTSVDLSLCVGDCSAGDATRAFDDLPTTTTTTSPDQPLATTTAPPISAPAVLPSLPSTTTTASAAPTTSAPTAAPTTVAPAPSPAPTAPAVTVMVAATAAPVADTAAPDTIAITLPPEPPPSEPPAPPPPPRTSPPKTTTTTTEPPPPTEPPLPPGQLVLGVEGGAGRATATYGFDGVGEQCAGADGDHVNGELSWEGAASGSELVQLDLGGGAGRGSREFTGLDPGVLTVTFRVCGEVGSATADIAPDGTRPSVGSLTFDPAAPSTGEPVTVSASIDTPRGWLCASVTWVVDGASTSSRCRGSSISHTLAGLTEGTHQVEVIVSFTRLIESADGSASGAITVTGTTTSVPETSTTSLPDSSSTSTPDTGATSVPPSDPSTSTPTDPPTSPPTDPPTSPPTDPPTSPPTDPPTSPPTDPPTSPPTEPPAPTDPTTVAPA